MTLMATALERAGIRQRDAHFNIALAKFINQGGTYDEAVALVHAAKEMSGAGRAQDAAKATILSPAPRQPIPGEAAAAEPQGRRGGPVESIDSQPAAAVSFGQSGHASKLSSHRGGESQSGLAHAGQIVRALSVREPSAASRAAAASVAKVVTITLMDTLKIRDGRAIGDVRYGEIEQLRNANTMEAMLFRQIQKRVGYADHDRKIRDLITADDLNAMKQKAAEMADAV